MFAQKSNLHTSTSASIRKPFSTSQPGPIEAQEISSSGKEKEGVQNDSGYSTVQKDVDVEVEHIKATQHEHPAKRRRANGWIPRHPLPDSVSSTTSIKTTTTMQESSSTETDISRPEAIASTVTTIRPPMVPQAAAPASPRQLAIARGPESGNVYESYNGFEAAVLAHNRSVNPESALSFDTKSNGKRGVTRTYVRCKRVDCKYGFVAVLQAGSTCLCVTTVSL